MEMSGLEVVVLFWLFFFFVGGVEVLNVITFGPKCNKLLNVITFSPKCNNI